MVPNVWVGLGRCTQLLCAQLCVHMFLMSLVLYISEDGEKVASRESPWKDRVKKKLP